MGWPRPRLRTLLVLVAVLAVALGVATIRWRRISCTQAASFHARESERLKRESLSAFLDELRAEQYAPKRSATEQERHREQSRSERLRRLAEWHGQLSQRYERAAARPWAPRRAVSGASAGAVARENERIGPLSPLREGWGEGRSCER